ncbi:MAG: Npt1/Npt2 family nucleotide transporter [Myxococcota bacterium]
MSRVRSNRFLTAIAGMGAALTIAAQVAGKATRDALFLSSFPVTDLPSMVVGSSILSIAMVAIASRLFARFGPPRVAPSAFVLSGILLLAEGSLAERDPAWAAIAVYLHFAVFNLLLVSGFWSVVNERFDPYSAKAQIARIALGATVGGVIGGLVAERVAGLFSLGTMFPLLAVCHFVAAGLVIAVGEERGKKAAPTKPTSTNGLQVLKENSYLREIAALLLVITVAAGFVDYVFKDFATARFDQREEMLRFFAVFYTGLGIVTFLVQSTIANPLLQRQGVARTVSVLPAALLAGSVGLFFLPGLIAASAARGAEAATRSSLFRTGYELLYTPVDENQKRAAKTLIDAGVDRLGDAAAALVISGLIFLVPDSVSSILVVSTAICGFGALGLAAKLHQGYVRTLEQRLLSHAEDLRIDPLDDVLRTGAIMQTLATVDIARLRLDKSSSSIGLGAELEALRQQAREQSANDSPSLNLDPDVRRLVELRSQDEKRVSAALLDPRSFSSIHVPQLIELLAWDEMSASASRVLRALLPSAAGSLVGGLLNPDEGFAIRRRVPRILAGCEAAWIRQALFLGLEDKRFEVRYQCGRALATTHREHPSVVFDRDQVCAAVLREVDVDRRVWESYRILDRFDSDPDDDTQWLDSYLADRTSRGLEHVFTLLALFLPSDPLKIAFRGLHADEPRLRGTALEYLESVLPEQIRERLWPFIDTSKSSVSDQPKDRSDLLENLLRSNAAIEASIASLPRKG